MSRAGSKRSKHQMRRWLGSVVAVQTPLLLSYLTSRGAREVGQRLTSNASICLSFLILACFV